jgi:hypothetical protein
MRKFSLFLLLASVAVPAFAAPGDGDRGNGRHHRDSNDSEQSENRQQRVRETQRSDNNSEQQRTVRSERVERNQAAQQGAREQMRAQVQQQREQRAQAAANQSNDGERVRNWRRTNDSSSSAQSSSWQSRERHVRTIPDATPNVRRDGNRGEVARAFTGRSRPDYRNGRYTRWTNHWRNDRRYDWSNYRNSHRSLFRIGIYSDPFGWSYRRWSIGSFLYPNYYGSNYWLNDPWQYRLPPAYGPYRWVRYWDDALLVNIYTGQVEDVLHNFFW